MSKKRRCNHKYGTTSYGRLDYNYFHDFLIMTTYTEMDVSLSVLV